MQTLLNDIELDIQELKCLMQAISNDVNPALRIVAKRNIQQMKARLDALQELLDETSAVEQPVAPEVTKIAPERLVIPEVTKAAPERPVISEVAKIVSEPSVAGIAETVQPTAIPVSSILAERIKPATDLRHAISLNDSFRFVRELFGGDTARMNEMVERLGKASSLDKAMDILTSEIHPDEENEATVDFMELLRKYFS